MSAHPEHPQQDPADRHDSVRWIGRDRLTPPTAASPAAGSPAAPSSLYGQSSDTALPPGGTPPVLPGFIRNNPVRWFAGVALILIALIALVVTRHLSDRTPTTAGGVAPGKIDIPVVTVMTPGITSVTSTVTFTGSIHARYDMPISPEGESGRVTAVLVEAGDRVKKGQVLARIDESVLRPQLNRLAASLEESKAQAALSAAEYRRAQGVEAAGALSAEEIARRHAASVTDEAKVKVAAAQLAEAQARLGKTEIRAPDDGIVLTRNAEVGQTANPGGEPLFRLARGGEMEMRGQVAERDLAALSVNQTAQVYLTGIDKPFEGTVRLLGAIIDPQTRLGDIRIALAPSPQIRPGAFARGEVSVGSAQRPVLPQTAVLSDAQGTYVLIVNGENKTERRGVRVANSNERGLVISSGLQGDERIVATAGAFLRTGEVVRVVDAKPERS